MVINSHKSSFQYNCLPFGVASASSIFQTQMVDTLFQGLNGVSVYLNEILVSAPSVDEHLQVPRQR